MSTKRDDNAAHQPVGGGGGGGPPLWQAAHTQHTPAFHARVSPLEAKAPPVHQGRQDRVETRRRLELRVWPALRGRVAHHRQAAPRPSQHGTKQNTASSDLMTQDVARVPLRTDDRSRDRRRLHQKRCCAYPPPPRGMEGVLSFKSARAGAQRVKGGCIQAPGVLSQASLWPPHRCAPRALPDRHVYGLSYVHEKHVTLPWQQHQCSYDVSQMMDRRSAAGAVSIQRIQGGGSERVASC